MAGHRRKKGTGSIFRPAGSNQLFVKFDGVTTPTHTLSHRQAEKILNELVKDASERQARAYNVRVKGEYDFPALWELLLADYRREQQDMGNLPGRHSHLEPFFGEMTPEQMWQRATVEGYRDERLGEGAKRATINNEMAALYRCLNLAQIPFVRLPNMTTNNERQNRPTREQVEQMAAKLPEKLTRLFLVGSVCGWRVSELKGLRWSPNVDLSANGFLRLEKNTTKNKEGRLFPFKFGHRLHTLLSAQREYVYEVERKTGSKVPWVFCSQKGKPIKNFYGAWVAACQELGFDDFIFHDLRRYAIHNLMKVKGITEKKAMLLTGHKSSSVFKRYAVYDPDDVAEVADLYEAHFAQDDQVAQLSQQVAALTPGQRAQLLASLSEGGVQQ